jgi:diguanylate cyclase (GGDEF)-like protein/PAS domain S-box-containing protein
MFRSLLGAARQSWLQSPEMQRIARAAASASVSRDDLSPLLRAITEHGPAAVIVVSLEAADRGRILYANPAANRLLHYPSHTLEQRTLGDIVLARDRDEILRQTTEAELESGDPAPRQLETRLKDRAGNPLWVLLEYASHGIDEGLAKRVVVLHATDIDERKRVERELQTLADHDPLTGLLNRRCFEEELRRAVAQVNRYGGSCAMMLIDFDGFKSVNDTLGHTAGDELIGHVGDLLRQTMRETDVLARIGGDEFAAVLPHTTIEDAIPAAKKILQTIGMSASRPEQITNVRVTASIGITAVEPGDATKPEDLLVEADLAMYRAKENGKDQFSVYLRDDNRRSELYTRGTLLSRLRETLAQDAFEVPVAPVYDVVTDQPALLELQPQMRDQHGTLVSPSSFLGADERTGMIREVDAWTLHEALRRVRDQPPSFAPRPLIVRLSAATLESPATLGHLGAQLGLAPLTAGGLVVELPAEPLARNPQYIAQVAGGLQQLGCELALSGFESALPLLPALRGLQLRYVTPGSAIPIAALTDASMATVMRMIATVAGQLGTCVMARDVDSPASVARLAQLGVKLYQRPAGGGQQSTTGSFTAHRYG